MLFKSLLIIQILTSVLLIGSVLLQHGKGADAGASFGGGSSDAVFGAKGSATFLSRLTAILTVIFFSLSIILAAMATASHGPAPSVVETVIESPASSGMPVIPE